MLNQSGMRLLVSAVQHKTSDYRCDGRAGARRVPGLADVVYIGERPGRTWWQRQRGRPRPAARAGARRLTDDAINIQYTSGTTGFPKGATLWHHNILNNGFFVGELVHYSELDRI